MSEPMPEVRQLAPRLLDLFCCAGGAGMGYSRAGFEVVGVDIKPQPHYPFTFLQWDALDVLRDSEIWGQFDVIHASPPCQAYAGVTAWRGDQSKHPDLVAETRELLQATGLPYVIENVREAPLDASLMLCGSMFGLPVRRHRYFELNPSLAGFVPPCDHRNLLPFMHKGERGYADALGCDWMSSKEGRQAIPPAYSEWIGRQLLQALGLGAAA